MDKRCATCNHDKPRSEFPSTGKQKRGDGTFRRVVKPDCKQCHNQKVLNQFHARLQSLGITFKCARCGYDRCKSGIDFHHLDPKQKDVRISTMVTASLSRLTSEVNKCIVLCKLCHVELHQNMWQLQELGL